MKSNNLKRQYCGHGTFHRILISFIELIHSVGELEQVKTCAAPVLITQLLIHNDFYRNKQRLVQHLYV